MDLQNCLDLLCFALLGKGLFKLVIGFVRFDDGHVFVYHNRDHSHGNTEQNEHQKSAAQEEIQ